jgi:hypothetical protein
VDDQRVAKGLKGAPNSLAGRYPGGYPRRGFTRLGTASWQLRLAVRHPTTPGGRALHAGLVWSEFGSELPFCLEPVSDVLPVIATARDVDFKGTLGYLQVGRLSSHRRNLWHSLSSTL